MKKARSAEGERRRLRWREEEAVGFPGKEREVDKVGRVSDISPRVGRCGDGGEAWRRAGTIRRGRRWGGEKDRAYFTRFQAESTRSSQQRVSHVVYNGPTLIYSARLA